MDKKVLINLFDEHNEASILAIRKIMPDKVIYIVEENVRDIYKESLKLWNDKFKNINFQSEFIKSSDLQKIKNILDSQIKNNCVVNVTGGNRIDSLLLLNESICRKFNTIYIDVLNKVWYNLGENCIASRDKFEDIYLKDLIELSGSNYLMDCNDLSKKKEVLDITKAIYNNLDLWYKYKSRLYDTNTFIHIYGCNDIKINLTSLDSIEVEILYKCLKYLSKIECIKFKKIDKQIVVTFIKSYIKGFIFKSGTWLEVLTDMVIREITEVDEVKNGVVFLWNNGKSVIKNELDVLAVKDSVLICVSCKDSEKYDEDALNELEVYSNRLGGKSAKKILVATRMPCKQCVMDRAQAMGINIVILNNDITVFRKRLYKIINNNM